MDGYENRHVRGYNFRDMLFGGDGSDEAARMGAGFCCLQHEDVKGCGCTRMGREQEGTSSNRPELAALEATTCNFLTVWHPLDAYFVGL